MDLRQLLSDIHNAKRFGVNAILEVIDIVIKQESSVPNRRTCYYYINTPKNEKGNLVVPKHKDIPKEQWGLEVQNRWICWYEEATLIKEVENEKQ